MTREELKTLLMGVYCQGQYESDGMLAVADLILPLVEAAEISERTIANGKLNICGVCSCLFHHCEGLHPECKGAKLRAALKKFTDRPTPPGLVE
jgi:hypothetical protein